MAVETFNSLLIILIAAVSCVTTSALDSSWEDVHIICPNQCACQHSHFMDLSIARWTQGIKNVIHASRPAAAAAPSNEAFDDTMEYESNPFLKFAMCMLQDNANIKDVLVSLPPDVQALVLLYNGVDKNVTLTASDLQHLTELTILEIRGGASAATSKQLQFNLDKPMSRLRYANFEAIELIGTDDDNDGSADSDGGDRPRKHRKHSVHPSEVFDYVPESERLATKVYNNNISLEMPGDSDDDEPEIVPYDVYKMEQKKMQMASFVGWTELNILRIHNCKLDELHWEMFDGLRQLEHLSLEHNAIKIVPPFAFYGAMHIKTLSLARNNILDMNYRSLAGLLELEWLNLSQNNLTKLSETSFPPFPRLQVVDFRENPIRYIFPMTFGVMNGTRHIFLGTEAQALDLLTTTGNSFRSLAALQSLTISNVSTAILHQGLFRDLAKLERLQLHGNLQLIEFDTFAGMPLVRELILSRCGIEEVSMDIFYGVRNLEIVDLSANRLQSLPPGLFDGQVGLREIYLQNNQLTELPADFFSNPAVKMIRLTENPWICTCEMTVWKQAITNRERAGRAPRDCDRNGATGHVTKCERNDNDYVYVFDNKLSPRCDGGPDHVRHRSVYYSLRKSMKCNQKKGTMESKKLAATNPLKYKHLTAAEKRNYYERYIKPRSMVLSSSSKAKNVHKDMIRQQYQRVVAARKKLQFQAIKPILGKAQAGGGATNNESDEQEISNLI